MPVKYYETLWLLGNPQQPRVENYIGESTGEVPQPQRCLEGPLARFNISLVLLHTFRSISRMFLETGQKCASAVQSRVFTVKHLYKISKKQGQTRVAHLHLAKYTLCLVAAYISHTTHHTTIVKKLDLKELKSIVGLLFSKCYYQPQSK